MNLNERSSGVLLHLTSLPGPHGVGDFGPAAYRFADWLQHCGQKIWQWLPTTPIGPGNSPYQSVSAFAGSPLMVALEPLVEQGWLTPPVLPAGGFPSERVDFERTVPWRLDQLRAAAQGFEGRATPAQRQAFERWCEAEASWLDDYALFMALETAHGGRAWWDWSEDLARREPQALARARHQHAAEQRFWCFVQWCFDTQRSALKAYCNARGISIMGDLPIFIAHHSADCWARPDLYALDQHFQPTVVTGVPPDDLGPLGQRWGNPQYRWDRMAAEDYAWWVARIRRMVHQVDVFRIDHFRGFAAYWEIPASSPTAVEGRWVPGPGKPLFDAITRALGPLPIVAEDLGFITEDVHVLRRALGYPSMKILQFAFGGDPQHEFLPHMYEREVVVYTGTHDNDTARGWWDQARDSERDVCGTYLACGQHDVHWAMIRAALNSVAHTAIFPLQDVLGLPSEHRMNTPGTMGGRNWAWRFDWPMVDNEPGRVLGLLTQVSGRGVLASPRQSTAAASAGTAASDSAGSARLA